MKYIKELIVDYRGWQYIIAPYGEHHFKSQILTPEGIVVYTYVKHIDIEEAGRFCLNYIDGELR
jgi:hypothetical protein